jgi:ribosome-associated toxin RatA of RatAB toxin-antitoxin module
MAAAERTDIVDVPLNKLYQAICDYDNYPKFVTGASNVKLLSREGNASRVQFDVEMMKRVEYVLKIKEEIDPEGRSARVSWTLDSSKFFKISNGLWELKALGPEKTQVLYKLELEFEIPVPGFVLKKLVASALPKTIQEFSDRARSL